MFTPDVLEALKCPSCPEGSLVAEKKASVLRCLDCGAEYPLVNGIVDMTVSGEVDEQPYQTERLSSLISSIYDVTLPAMSAALWRCSPLRFVDWGNMVVGRSKGGRHLAFPVQTGRLYKHIYGEHLEDVSFFVADQSWKMLKRAQRNFKRAGITRAIFLKVSARQLPFAADQFESLLSMNGLHGFQHRDRVWTELQRVVVAGGIIAGSTLIREQERIAHKVLGLFEEKGVAPMPPSKEYIVAELEALEGATSFHEHYGSVLFFGVELDKVSSPENIAA